MGTSINTDSKRLSNRINAHKKYSKLDINEWIFKIICAKTGEKLLDIGCGTGEQIIRFARVCDHSSSIVGIDLSLESLEIVKENCAKDSIENVMTIKGNMDDLLKLLSSGTYFDIAISCFALYYSKNIPQLISNIKKFLNQNGRFFVCGPYKGNNSELIRFQSQISPSNIKPTQYPMTELILPEVLKNFDNVSKHYFQNPVEFPNPESLIKYWKSYILFDSKIEHNFISHTKKYFKGHTKFITTKKVIGILAYM